MSLVWDIILFVLLYHIALFIATKKATEFNQLLWEML